MRTDRELFEDALHQLGWLQQLQDFLVIKDLIDEIRARLTEKDHEPVAWYEQTQNGECFLAYSRNPKANTRPLYRHPPHQPVHLSNTEIRCIIKNVVPDVTVSESVTFRAVARAIEQAILERNK